mgnify:CR=1 FL=1
MLRRKSQAWSVDVILAVVIFMGAFFLYYAIANSSSSSDVTALKADASSVIKQVSNEGDPLSIVSKQEINITKVGELKDRDYDELKSQFRVEGNFCIYIEDEKGNLVMINNSYRGVGSPNINISGVPCSQK